MSNGHPIPELRLFENLTLKIKGQGHGWGHSSKSKCGSSILSIHIPFVPCQSALPFLRYSIFKIWPWKSRVKVKWPWCCTTTGLDNSIELRMVQIHPAVSEIWVPQSLAQVLPDLTSFWPIGKPIRGKWANDYDSAQLQVQTSPWNFKWGQSIQRFQRYAFRKVWPNLCQIWQVFGPWASPYGANGQMNMTVHNYRPRQFHRTSNGENPSSGYRDMGSASLAAARPAARPDRDDNTPPARRAEG